MSGGKGKLVRAYTLAQLAERLGVHDVRWKDYAPRLGEVTE